MWMNDLKRSYDLYDLNPAQKQKLDAMLQKLQEAIHEACSGYLFAPIASGKQNLMELDDVEDGCENNMGENDKNSAGKFLNG